MSETPPHPSPANVPAAPESETGWYDEPDELPPRPRHRLLTPVTVALMLVLFAAVGFVGGVLVQKNQGSSSATVVGAGTTSRFTGAGATGAGGFAGLRSGAAGFAGRFGALFGAGGAGVSGTVTDISGDRLYVTTAAGTMSEVITTPESKITKSESVGASSIHPGDEVVASGVTGSSGALTASSITDSGNTGTSISTGTGSSTAGTSTSGSAASGLFGG